MIDVVSYAKKKESVGSGGSGVGGGLGGSQNSTLEPHLLWGQVYDGRHDISGDLLGVGNIESDGSISAKSINTQTGKLDSVTGQELRYTTIIGGSISATDSTITNLTTTTHTSQALTTTNLNSDTGTITDLSTQTHNTQQLTAKGVDTERLTGKDIVVDNLTVNKAAHFFSLSVDEVRAVGGQLILTPASAKLDKVEVLGNGSFKCSWKNSDGNKKVVNQFLSNDLVVCQTFNLKTGSTYYWRKCIEAGTDGDYNYIILSNTDKDSNSNSNPSVGDEIVQLGNTSDTSRQSAIIISAYNSTYLDPTIKAPSIVQYSGISSYQLEPYRQNVLSKSGNKFQGEFRVDNGKTLESYIADRIKLTASGTPYIGNNNNWWIWDKDQSKYKDSGISAAGRNGQDGLTPRIVNNVWWIGNTNTGISAVGQKGDKGDRGEKGDQGLKGDAGVTPRIVDNVWWIGNTNTNVPARGQDGRDLDPTPYYKLYDRGGSVAVVDTNSRLNLNIDLGLIEVVGQSASSVSSDNTPANKILYKGGLIAINREGRFKYSQELPYTGQTTFTFNLLSGDKLVDSYTIPVTVLPSTVFSVTDQIKAQVQDTKQSINNVTGRIGTVENKVTQLTQTADTIKAQVQNNKTNLDTVTGKIRQAESSISSLTQKAGSIEQTVAGTRTELDNLKQTTTRDINTLRQTASETESKVSRVEETVRDFSVGGQNLLNGVIDFRQPTPLLHTSKDKDGYFYYRGVTSELLEAGKKYTLQLKSDGILARGHERQGDKSFTVWLCGKSDNLLFTSSNSVSDCVWTFTCPTTDHYILRLNSYSDGVKYESVKFWDIKLEEGNIATGWSPSSSDLYNYYSINRVGFDFVQNFPNDHHPAQSISYNHSTDTITMTYNVSKAGGQLQDIDYTVLFDSNSYAIPNGQYLVRFTPYLSAADVRLFVEIDNKESIQTPIDYSQPANVISGSEVSRIVEVKDNYLRIYFESAHQAGQDTTRDWSIALTGLKVTRINSTESYLKQSADLIEAKVRNGDIILDAKRVKVRNGNNETALFENGKIKTSYIESQGGLFSVSDDGFYYRGTVKDVENETVETKIHNHGLSTRVDETVLKDGIFQSVSISPYSRDTNINIVSNSQEAVSISSVSNNLEAAISITDGAVYGLRALTRRYKGGNYTLDTYVKNVIVTGASDLENQVLGNQGTNLQLPDNDLLTKGMLSHNPTSAERVKYINKYHQTAENLQAGQEYIIFKRSSGRLVISVDEDPRKKISIAKYNQGNVEVVKSVLFTVNWVGIIKVLYDGQNWNLYVDSTNY